MNRLNRFALFVLPFAAISTSQNNFCLPQVQNDRWLMSAKKTAAWLKSVKRTDEAQMVFWPNVPSESERASHDLYHGNSGIVWFYLSLYETTNDQQYLVEAKAGADRLITHVKQLPNNEQPGYYTGVAGYGATLLRTWKLTNDDNAKRAAIACLTHLKERQQKKPHYKGNAIHFNGVTDVISGSAGIIDFLLQAHEVLKRDEALELAIRCADGLIADGRPTKLTGSSPQMGLRWRMSDQWEREYPNASHGTAGIVAALLKVHEACEKSKLKKNHGRFLTAAEQGIAYLNSIAKKENGQWLVHHHSPGGEDLYYLGWCHGPPGTGPVLIQHARMTNNKSSLKFAMGGAKAILDLQLAKNRTPGFWNNVSRCCGTSSVAHYLYEIHQVQPDQKYYEECVRLTDDLLKRATSVKLNGGKTGLKWIQAENRVDPKGLKAQTGWMQGAAGIGDWLLKMHEFELQIQNQNKNQ